jgi:plasmid rolling circle replication initiator protein Rep
VTDDTLGDLFEERRWLPSQPKRGSLALADTFDTFGGKYTKLADRMRECGSILEFACYRVGDDEDLKRVLVRCSWCRVRLCFLCERARSRKRHVQLCKVLTAWLGRRPRDQALLLTLTIRSCPNDGLREAIDQLLASVRRLTRCRRFQDSVTAWHRTLEVTRDADTGLWHPHVHLLLIVPPRYFTRGSGLYIQQPEWAALWRKFARLDYDPVIDVRALKGVGGGPLAELGRKSLAEVTKYCSKPSDLVTFDDEGEPYPVDANGLKALYDALHGRRLVGMSGALQALAKELRLADPDADDADLGATDSFPDDAVYLGREFYRWHHDLRDYVCVPRVVWPTQAQEHQMPP